MRALHSVKSRTKFIIATAVLNAAVLAFVGDASAAKKETGQDIDMRVVDVCTCRKSCTVYTYCLAEYCYSQTVCSDCSNCEGLYLNAPTKRVPGQKLCIYRPSPHQCVTKIKTHHRRFWQH